MLPLLPLAIGGLVGVSWWAQKHRKGGMTAERKILLDTLINTPQTPATLKTMADAFEKQGLKPQAEMLRKRAALRELPDDVKERRKQVFRDAMASQDPAAVLKVAAAFDKEGYTGNAAALRTYAAGLKKAAAAAPKTTAAPKAEDVKPPESPAPAKAEDAAA